MGRVIAMVKLVATIVDEVEAAPELPNDLCLVKLSPLRRGFFWHSRPGSAIKKEVWRQEAD